MAEIKPTRGAQRRFETLQGMFPTSVIIHAGVEDDQEPTSITGTTIDISTGCLCVRIPLGDDDADLLRASDEGDYVEAVVAQSPNHKWQIMGHMAWIWVPTMMGDDTVGSLGIDIAGVGEDDRRWFGKIIKIMGNGAEVEVDRTARPRLSPAKRRQLGDSCGLAEPENKEKELSDSE